MKSSGFISAGAFRPVTTAAAEQFQFSEGTRTARAHVGQCRRDRTTVGRNKTKLCRIDYGVHGQQKPPSGTRTTVHSSIHVTLLCSVDPFVVVPQSFQETRRHSRPTIGLVEMGNGGFWHCRVGGQRHGSYRHHAFVVSNLTHATLVGLF